MTKKPQNSDELPADSANVTAAEPESLEDSVVEQLSSFDAKLADEIADLNDVGNAVTNDSERVDRGKQALRMLDAIRLFDPQALDASHSDPDVRRTKTTAISPALPSKIGRFEIIRQLGGGGQGVVSLARDPRLNRFVALKVPRPEILMTEDLKARFLREAEVAAALNHPNIVPIYEQASIGPICYIASAYCEGASLDQWAASTTIHPRLAAQITLTLADALQHAHNRGVLHRDVKPSNVLFDTAPPESGADENAFCQAIRLTDFGLARIEAMSGMTKSYAVIGTPAFMSPEQAAGRAKDITNRADIYGLGATLYWLLTGKAPIVGETDNETLLAIQTTEPNAPGSTRRGIPADLDAVALKCLEKDPKRRYESAAALGADLQRFLDGDPVHARKITRMVRVRRWCAKNPLLAASLLAIVLLTAAAFGWISRERNVAHRNWQRSVEQQRRAERNSQLSRMAADRLLTEVAEGLDDVPAAQQARREILTQALDIYASLASDMKADKEATRDVSLAALNLGNVHTQLEEFKKAEAALRNAERQHRALIAESPDDQQLLSELAVVLDRLSYTFDRQRKNVEAVKHSAEAVTVWDRAVAIGELDAEQSLRCLRTRLLHAMHLERVNELQDAADLYRECVRQTAADMGRFSHSAEFRFEHAVGMLRLGNLLNNRLKENSDDLNDWIPRAMEEFRNLHDSYPTKRSFHEWYGLSLAALTSSSSEAEAEVYLQESLAVYQDLADSYPNIPSYQHRLAMTWFTEAEMRLERQQRAAAEESLNKVVSIMSRLVERFPTNRGYQVLHAMGKDKLVSAIDGEPTVTPNHNHPD